MGHAPENESADSFELASVATMSKQFRCTATEPIAAPSVLIRMNQLRQLKKRDYIESVIVCFHSWLREFECSSYFTPALLFMHNTHIDCLY